MPFVCFFFSCKPIKLSFISVVFDFNASLNDVAPLSPILLSVYLMRMKKVNQWWTSFMCCFSPIKSSLVSVVLIFNASLNDVAPVSPMKLTVKNMNFSSEELMCVILNDEFFYVDNSLQMFWVWCLFSVLHWVMLLQDLSTYLLLVVMSVKKKSELLFCVIGVSVSSRTFQIKICECCVCFESFT